MIQPVFCLSCTHMDFPVTIHLQVYQRQLSKEGLQSVVNSSTSDAGTVAADMPVNSMSSEELRNLFTLRSDTLSDTYDSVCCRCERSDSQSSSPILEMVS